MPAARACCRAGSPTAASLLEPGGVLTLIWRADAADDVLAALASGFGAIAMLQGAPRPDRHAIRVLVRAVKEAAAHGPTVHTRAGT